MDTDLDRLKVRIADYFNEHLSHEEIARRYPRVMQDTGGFDARATRETLFMRGGPNQSGFIRYAYRPFDNRWLYWEVDSGLLDRPRPDYKPHLFIGNMWLVAQNRSSQEWFPAPAISHIASMGLTDFSANCFPTWLREEELNVANTGRRPNLSEAAQGYLKRIGASVEDLFHHTLSTLHDPAYREANAGALRMEWPRIPLPGWPSGGAEVAAKTLAESAERGRELACLLDIDAAVPGVTQAPLQQEMAVIGVPSTTAGDQMMSDDFAVTAGWGHYGAGRGRDARSGAHSRAGVYRRERTDLGDALPVLGEKAFDVYLNERAFWRCIPAAVWNYKLGGYQVLKKWLSYRERDILKRPLNPEEVQHFTDTARRIAGVLMLTNGAHP